MIRVFFLGPCFKAGTVSFYNLQQILHNFLLQPCRGRRQPKGSGGTAQTSVFKQFCCRRTRCCCCCFCLLLLLLLGLISCFEGSSAFSLPFNRPQAHIRHLNSPCPVSLPLSLSLALLLWPVLSISVVATYKLAFGHKMPSFCGPREKP